MFLNHPPATTPLLPPVPVDFPQTGSLSLPRLLAACFLLVVISCGLYYRKISHHNPLPAAAAPAGVPLTRNQERWIYFYEPDVKRGEKPDSEGNAIAADQTGFYVAGQIETKTEGTDMLLLKVSRKGKLIWAERYHSPHHDCDRAYSVCVDDKDNLYVAGETYVPSGHSTPEGWYLTLLHYDQIGHRLWARRSPLPIQNEGHRMQVASDGQQGCYVAGTALVKGKQTALVMRYDSSGKILWQKTLPEGGQSSVFSQFAVNAEGTLTLCGTTRHETGQSGVNENWMVVCLDPNGKIKWRQREEGTAQGSNTANRIIPDRAGNIYVGGVFSTRGSSPSSQGVKLGVVKYSPDGTRLWRRVVEDSGPTVVMEGLSLNPTGNLVVGGTEHRLDGHWEIVLHRFDGFGNLRQSWSYANPAGYHSAALLTPALLGSEETRIVGRMAPSSTDEMNGNSSILFARFSPEGHLLQQSLFDGGVYAPNKVNDLNPFVDFVFTGQAGMANNEHSLMLICY